MAVTGASWFHSRDCWNTRAHTCNFIEVNDKLNSLLQLHSQLMPYARNFLTIERKKKKKKMAIKTARCLQQFTYDGPKHKLKTRNAKLRMRYIMVYGYVKRTKRTYKRTTRRREKNWRYERWQPPRIWGIPQRVECFRTF